MTLRMLPLWVLGVAVATIARATVLGDVSYLRLAAYGLGMLLTGMAMGRSQHGHD